MAKHVRRGILCISVGICVLVFVELGLGQSAPTPDRNRLIYTYFPSSLVCSKALGGNGPSVGPITIGETTLGDLAKIYAEHFLVSAETIDGFDATLIALHDIDDDALFQRFEACVEDGVIIAVNGVFPSLTTLDNLSDEVDHPVSFQLVGIQSFVARYSVPDVVTYSPNPTHRVAFWFTQGIAAEFYVRFDPLDSEFPPAFGSLSKVIYFPFQNEEGYEGRWPFNQTYPEWIFVNDDELPSERNPFDFDFMIAALTAEPTQTSTQTPKSPIPVATATPSAST